MSRHRYPGWKSGLREGCNLISPILPSHTGVNEKDDGGGVGGDDDGGEDVYDDDVNKIDAL